MPNRPKHPKPRHDIAVKCPSCGHPIDHHNQPPHGQCGNPVDGVCLCTWTPNDIAAHLLVGDLTRVS